MKHKHPKLESLRKSPEAIAGKDYKFSCSSALQSSKNRGKDNLSILDPAACLVSLSDEGDPI